MWRFVTFSLVLPTTLVLWAFAAQAQQNANPDRSARQRKIERLQQMADSLQLEADRLREDMAKQKDFLDENMKQYKEYMKRFADSLKNTWDFKHYLQPELIDPENFKFDWDDQLPSPPAPQYRYTPDPNLPGNWLIEPPAPEDIEKFRGRINPTPLPRNIQPSPRVIPKRPDGNDVPRFRGWRFEKLT